ncbi:MAG TPA: lipid-A-disaccharide synthase [Terrimicrobiaceae bacterium]
MTTLWFVAGEASGDARAAEVMKVLDTIGPKIRFLGAGGPRMRAIAADPFDDWIAEAAVLGLWDVLKHYGYFRKKFHRMIEQIEETKPNAIVLVDYPGFNLRLAKALRARRFPGKILFFISPQVWAWNRGRIPKMARLLDLMICVFPFEKPMYEASGLHTIFVGHPLLEALATERSGAPRDENLLGLFPGSREREVKRIFPIMVEGSRLILERRPDVRLEAAAASEAHAVRMRQMASDSPIVIRSGTAHQLMQRACAGIVCSGTATLEAAFFGLPYFLVYRVAWLTFEVGRRLVDVDCLGIINILNNYKQNPPADPRLPAKPAPHVVREFIQHFATPGALASEALRLLNEPQARTDLVAKVNEIVTTLEAEGATRRASQAILDALR